MFFNQLDRDFEISNSFWEENNILKSNQQFLILLEKQNLLLSKPLVGNHHCRSQLPFFFSRYEHKITNIYIVLDLGKRKCFYFLYHHWQVLQSYNVTFIFHICWLINLKRKKTFIFLFISENLFSNTWHVTNMLTFCFVSKWNIFYFSYCILSLHLTLINFYIMSDFSLFFVP